MLYNVLLPWGKLFIAIMTCMSSPLPEACESRMLYEEGAYCSALRESKTINTNNGYVRFRAKSMRDPKVTGI